MANWEKDKDYPTRGESLHHWKNLETNRPPVSKYNNSSTSLQVHPSKMALLEAKAYQREDRSMGTQSGEKFDLGNWPMPRSMSSREDIRAHDNGAADPRGHYRLATVPSSAQRHMLPGANLAVKGMGTLNKRKASVSDLGLGPMTTVQEACLDSPTIPGHHPIFVRSMTYPDYAQRHSKEICETTPRGSEFLCVNTEKPLSSGSSATSSDKTARRRSSMILPKGPAPWTAPSNTATEQADDLKRPEPSDEQEDKPPQVPPKSPRTESRASPRPKKFPHSANASASSISSASTFFSTASASTSTSSLVGRASPKPAATPPRVEVTFGRDENPNNVKESVRVAHWARLDRIGRQTPPRAHSPRSYPRNPKIDEQEKTTSPLAGQTRTGNSSSFQERDGLVEKSSGMNQAIDINQTWHQRVNSEASVIDRGRPLGRGDTSLMQKLSKPILRTPSLDEVEIPTGFRAKEASSIVPRDELKLLKRQADEKVENFEVLSIKDVSNLSKEMALLDERCEYLRHTYNSLRLGRRGLHTRMISYLKSPRMAKFSCDSILKQEEALAELDLSIDDWVSKLEQAENRRTRVRQKLLEHVAATLTVRTSANIQPQHLHEVQTPPGSPEKTENNSSKAHRDVQSSEFYADSGVAALLSAIEMEIGGMDDLAQAS